MPRLSESDLCVIQTCWEEKGWRGSKMVVEFPKKGWTARSIDRAILRLLSTGSIAQSKHHGPKRTATSEENQARIEEMVLSEDNEPGKHLSHRQLARRLNISRRSIQRICQRAGMKPYRPVAVSEMSHAVKLKRVQRCRALHRQYNLENVKRMCFQDEKDFTLQGSTARKRKSESDRNDVDPSESDVQNHEVDVGQSTSGSSNSAAAAASSAKLMVSGCVSWEGKSRLSFLNPQEMKFSATAFIRHLEHELLPECKRLYPNDGFILVVDGAAAHRANSTQQYLSNHAPRFIPATEWPPNSPDLNPFEYCVWNVLQKKVYEGRDRPFGDLNELRQRIEECWELLPHDTIRKAISQWRQRLSQVIKENGGSITHVFAS